MGRTSKHGKVNVQYVSRKQYLSLRSGNGPWASLRFQSVVPCGNKNDMVLQYNLYWYTAVWAFMVWIEEDHFLPHHSIPSEWEEWVQVIRNHLIHYVPRVQKCAVNWISPITESLSTLRTLVTPHSLIIYETTAMGLNKTWQFYMCAWQSTDQVIVQQLTCWCWLKTLAHVAFQLTQKCNQQANNIRCVIWQLPYLAAWSWTTYWLSFQSSPTKSFSLKKACKHSRW